MAYKRTPESNRMHVKEARKKMRVFVRALKDKPCNDCREEYPHYVMQFDHVRGKKLFGLSRVSSTFVSKSRVVAEIEKCDVVCANCHAARTWKRKSWENIPG